MSDLASEPETGTGDLEVRLGRRMVAEALGTGLLLLAVVGSGIMATRLAPDQEGLQLLASSLATAGALVAIILAFGAVSGAHLNPAVTLLDRSFGAITSRDATAYVGAQIAGACSGAIVANVIFDLPAVTRSTQVRSSPALWASEVVATAGLLVIIHGCVRAGRADAVAFAVAGWIAGAYWFTSSTSFANPAATLGRAFTDTFAGIAPSSVPAFLVAQLVGAALAYLVIRTVYPHRETAP